MPKPKRPEEEMPAPPLRQTWNVNDTNVRHILRLFEAEINKFAGPWKFELWMVANRCIKRDPSFKIVKVTLPDGSVVDKPEYNAVYGFAFGQAQEKYKALRILQKMTVKAKSMQEGPMPERPEMAAPREANLNL